MSSGVRTFRETRLAVGRLRDNVVHGPVHPTKPVSQNINNPNMSNVLNMAIGRIKKRSMKRNYNFCGYRMHFIPKGVGRT